MNQGILNMVREAMDPKTKHEIRAALWPVINEILSPEEITKYQAEVEREMREKIKQAYLLLCLGAQCYDNLQGEKEWFVMPLYTCFLVRVYNIPRRHKPFFLITKKSAHEERQMIFRWKKKNQLGAYRYNYCFLDDIPEGVAYDRPMVSDEYIMMLDDSTPGENDIEATPDWEDILKGLFNHKFEEA